MSGHEDHTMRLQVERVLPAPRERVFEAWTDAGAPKFREHGHPPDAAIRRDATGANRGSVDVRKHVPCHRIQVVDFDFFRD